MKIGYFLSSEEYTPAQLIEQARLAEESGFDGLWISDHFHPWNDEQGQSAFVWSAIGAISQVCELPVTTAVTCPTVRIHPAVIAQAAATSAVLLNGRFTLGIGTGEALNEHVLGDVWPTVDVRLEMLEEAVEIMRRLWTEDGFVTHHGKHYTVDTARIYTRPDIAAADLHVRLRARGDRCRRPDRRRLHHHLAGPGTPASASGSTAAGTSRRRPASRSATRRPRTKVSSRPTASGATPACPASWRRSCRRRGTSSRPPSSVTKEQTAESVAAGPKADDHLEAFKPYVEAGFDEIYVANMGPHSVDMMKLYRDEVLPELRRSPPCSTG